MGSSGTKPIPTTDKPGFQSTQTSLCVSDCTIFQIYPYLLVAFVAGILLTLLILAIITLIKKCCQKCRTSHSQKIPEASDPSHKSCPTAEDTQTCADTSLQDSKENSVYFVKHQNEESDPIVYAEVRVQTKTSLPTTGNHMLGLIA